VHQPKRRHGLTVNRAANYRDQFGQWPGSVKPQDQTRQPFMMLMA
jgi:hypothetical protein